MAKKMAQMYTGKPSKSSKMVGQYGTGSLKDNKKTGRVPADVDVADLRGAKSNVKQKLNQA